VNNGKKLNVFPGFFPTTLSETKYLITGTWDRWRRERDKEKVVDQVQTKSRNYSVRAIREVLRGG